MLNWGLQKNLPIRIIDPKIIPTKTEYRPFTLNAILKANCAILDIKSPLELIDMKNAISFRENPRLNKTIGILFTKDKSETTDIANPIATFTKTKFLSCDKSRIS